MPTKKQLDNLKPLNQRAKSVQREISSKGGKARAKKLKERKTFQEIAQIILGLAMTSGKTADLEQIKSIADLKGMNLTVEEGIILQQAMKALKGDRFAAEFIRDTAGEKPAEKVEVNQNIKDVTQRIEEIFAEERENET